MFKRFLLVFSPALCALASVQTAWAQEGSDEFKPNLVPIPPGRQDFLAAIWVLVIFAFLLLILYPTAWKNVLTGLKAREERIRKSIADAEAARTKAEETLRQYDGKLIEAEQKVREILDRATSDAEKIATSLRMKAQEEAEEAKERAAKEIEAAKHNAISEIYQQTVYLATSVAEKIIRRNLNADDQRDLVNQSLDQLQSIAKN